MERPTPCDTSAAHAPESRYNIHMNDDQFTKLFNYIEDFRNEVNSKIDQTATRDSVERLTGTIDAFIKCLDTIETEQAARDTQFNRLLERAREVSKSTGVPLPNL